MKKKNDVEASDEDDEYEPKEFNRRKTRGDVKKKVVIKDALLEDFTTVDVSQEKLVSHLFHNK